MFSSHILQEVEAMCSRVIIINKGVIVADDQLSNLQKNKSGQHLVVVRFKEEVSKEILRKLKAVSEVTHLNNSAYQLSTNDPDDVRKQLLELSLKNNLNIVSLQSESSSLEDIFRSLTSPANNN